MIEVHELQIFLAAAEEENFSAAARKLHLSQPAISFQIQGLEQRLNVQLFQRMGKRTTLADALHQAGQNDGAEALFREAEAMQAEQQPDYPLLYSLRGFLYCDLLLAAPERVAWQALLRSSRREEAHSIFPAGVHIS